MPIHAFSFIYCNAFVVDLAISLSALDSLIFCCHQQLQYRFSCDLIFSIIPFIDDNTRSLLTHKQNNCTEFSTIYQKSQCQIKEFKLLIIFFLGSQRYLTDFNQFIIKVYQVKSTSGHSGILGGNNWAIDFVHKIADLWY